MKKTASFWAKGLAMCSANFILAAIVLQAAAALFDWETATIIFIFTSIIFTLILSAWYSIKKRARHIWFIPISQAVAAISACVFLLIRDLLGLRPSQGFLDFGVSFEIFLVLIYGARWIIPSTIAALIYPVFLRKSKPTDER